MNHRFDLRPRWRRAIDFAILAFALEGAMLTVGALAYLFAALIVELLKLK